jgi:hypothetical protein
MIEGHPDWCWSKLLCPVCSNNLLGKRDDTGVYLWCGRHECPSVGANEGARGRNEEAALTILRQKLNL